LIRYYGQVTIGTIDSKSKEDLLRNRQPSDVSTARVVIVGSGFAGLFAAKEIARNSSPNLKVELTLVDRNNYQLFLPLLYHVASGGMGISNICLPIRPMIEKWAKKRGNFKFIECQVSGIDFNEKFIETDRKRIDFDYLVLATGSSTNYYNIPGAEPNALPLKTPADAVAIHNRILEKFETAVFDSDPERCQRKLTFVVIGGGPTGVEMCSTLALFLFKTISRSFPSLMPSVRLVLVEGSASLLGNLRPNLGKLAKTRLEKMGVEILLNFRVKNVDNSVIEADDGRHLESENIIWVAGIKPGPLVQKLDLPKSRDGRIVVNSNFEVDGHPGVYAIGDCSYLLEPDSKRAYPATAQSAVKMGTTCGGNICKKISGVEAEPFEYRQRTDIVFLGRNYAVGELYGAKLHSFAAYIMYVSYHLVKLTGFKNKMKATIDWVYAYFSDRNVAKI
jgi:NADH:ubiquinone reductase (H+-translocating)